MDAAVNGRWEVRCGPVDGAGGDEPAAGERSGTMRLRAALRLVRAAFWVGVILASLRWQRSLVVVSKLTGLGREAAQLRWARVHEANARRVFAAATRLSGAWVKLGQVASTFGAFLPAPYVRELTKLQDQVPPRPFAVIDEAIFRSWGRPWQVAFAEISARPVAAASLGQVHRAVTHSGEVVAVKVLYPEVRATLAADVTVLGWILRLLARAYPVDKLERLHQAMASMLVRETDLRAEARALGRMARCFEGDASVTLPEVFPALTTDRVLVMSFVEGVRLTDRDGLARLGVAPGDAMRTLLDAFCKQLFVFRFFHADPHPGNYLIQRGPDGRARVALLDLGATADAPGHIVDGLVELAVGCIARDEGRVVAGLRMIGFIAGDGEGVSAEVRSAMARFVAASSAGGDLARALTSVAEGAPGASRARELMREVRYPEGWFEVERALTMLVAVCASEAPQLDPTRVLFPHLARAAAARRVVATSAAA